jgi:hypothetical protein
MSESFPKPKKSNLETMHAPELAEKNVKELIEEDVTEAKRLHGEGEFDKALDLLENALDKAYRADEMDIYDTIVNLLEEWES